MKTKFLLKQQIRKHPRSEILKLAPFVSFNVTQLLHALFELYANHYVKRKFIFNDAPHMLCVLYVFLFSVFPVSFFFFLFPTFHILLQLFVVKLRCCRRWLYEQQQLTGRASYHVTEIGHMFIYFHIYVFNLKDHDQPYTRSEANQQKKKIYNKAT